MFDAPLAGSADTSSSASTVSPSEPSPGGVEQSSSLHILGINPDYDGTYGWSYVVTFSLDGETVQQATFARQGTHDDFAIVEGDESLDGASAFYEICDVIVSEAEGRAIGDVLSENTGRAAAWLAFREGSEEESADAMLPRTIEIPMLTLREIGDLYWSEQAALVGGGR